MRTLLAFIWRHHVILLFFLLELAAGVMIIRFNRHHAAIFFRFTRESSASLHETMYDVNAFFHLRSENEKLATENARLLAEMPASSLITDTATSVTRDSLGRPYFKYRNAEVISNSVTRRNNHLVLNKGSLHGLLPNMGVIAPDGVVGIVSIVSPNFASVVSVLHRESRISAEMLHTGYKGYISWDGFSYRRGILSDIPSHAPLSIGDTVISSSDSRIFPRGIMIGTVTDFEVDPATNFYHVRVEFSCDYNRLRHVIIVENLFSTELDSLVSANQPEEE